MPYIKQEDRDKYDDLIWELAVSLTDNAFDGGSISNDKLSGHLNYVMFRLGKLLCGWTRDDPSYARMAVFKSALSEARDEFSRRVMVPYEDEKIDENGDVTI